MKKALSLLVFLIFASSSFAQQTEFTVSGNGLIYSDTTIQQLKHIVDSLNLKFKVCDLNKMCQSKLQAKAHFVYIEKNKVKEAKKDIEANMIFNDFEKKYTKAHIDKEVLMVRYEYTDYNNKQMIGFSNLELNNDGHELTLEKKKDDYSQHLKGKWLYAYNTKESYSPECLSAIYFTEELTSIPLPIAYSRMIQYSDCMVDTTTQIFYESEESDDPFSNPKSAKVEEFMTYIDKAIPKPSYDDYYDTKNSDAVNDSLYEIFRVTYHRWDSLRLQKMDSLKSSDKKFMPLFREAEAEALAHGGGNDEFEEYVAVYSSKKNALEMKRHRLVYGHCSQDDSPRRHAVNIAILSAETVNWATFLRAHLDIMNDRFERMSDGSYAWAKRQTYIKELEVLDINVTDLLLGISLRIENAGNNHYYGNIGRLGRALAETEHPGEVEDKMLQMIADTQLDDFNRIVIYYLFLNYNYNLTDQQRKEVNQQKIETAEKTLPAYLYNKLHLAKKKK